MAEQAKRPKLRELPAHTSATETIEITRDRIKEAAARLLAQGYSVEAVAEVLWRHMTPRSDHRLPAYRKRSARTKIRGWRREQSFRDLMYENGLRELDLAAPAIMRGVAGKAKRGRVDAARLAFELTGRHVPKGEAQPTQVHLHIEGVPRPARAVEEIVEGEVVEEQDDV